jgi:hypothetical protein
MISGKARSWMSLSSMNKKGGGTGVSLLADWP